MAMFAIGVDWLGISHRSVAEVTLKLQLQGAV
jgi:hypothetical protein